MNRWDITGLIIMFNTSVSNIVFLELSSENTLCEGRCGCDTDCDYCCDSECDSYCDIPVCE